MTEYDSLLEMARKRIEALSEDRKKLIHDHQLLSGALSEAQLFLKTLIEKKDEYDKKPEEGNNEES